jgi:hypothetical protein
MIAGEMRVLECHADVLVPHHSLHRWQVDATHDQPTRKNMTQVIEGKIYHTRLGVLHASTLCERINMVHPYKLETPGQHQLHSF